MDCERWLRFAEGVAPDVAWDCADDGLGNVVLIASRHTPNGRGVHLMMPVREPRNGPVPETAEAIRALAEDLLAEQAA